MKIININDEEKTVEAYSGEASNILKITKCELKYYIKNNIFEKFECVKNIRKDIIGRWIITITIKQDNYKLNEELDVNVEHENRSKSDIECKGNLSVRMGDIVDGIIPSGIISRF